jgi:hypothetical protein
MVCGCEGGCCHGLPWQDFSLQREMSALFAGIPANLRGKLPCRQPGPNENADLGGLDAEMLEGFADQLCAWAPLVVSADPLQTPALEGYVLLLHAHASAMRRQVGRADIRFSGRHHVRHSLELIIKILRIAYMVRADHRLDKVIQFSVEAYLPPAFHSHMMRASASVPFHHPKP